MSSLIPGPLLAEEQSSVATFNYVLKVLTEVTVRVFLLENVDMEEPKASGDTNLQIIIDKLTGIDQGYHLRVFKVLSSDFGSPQRRIRLYFLGVSKRFYPEIDMNRMTKHLEAFKLQSQSPDTLHEILSNCMWHSEVTDPTCDKLWVMR